MPSSLPTAIPCPRCHAPAGAPCRDYRGRAKPVCPERRQAITPPLPAPRPEPVTIDQPAQLDLGTKGGSW